MKKALITGITGQDGSYLAELLISKGYEVHGFIRRSSTFNRRNIEHIFNTEEKREKFLHYGDMTDINSMISVFKKVNPDEIYNLAAQSHVKISFEIPFYTAQSDAIGVLNVLEAARILNIKARIYQASTSELYSGDPTTSPQSEKTPFKPKSPYGVAKLYGFEIARVYRESYNMFVCNGILFNHESPRRGSNFVTRKITKGIAEIKSGIRERISIGNLDAKRDWGFAPEYMEAAWMMLQKDKPDDYVISTGETHSVRELIVEAFKHINVGIEWRGKGIKEEGVDSNTKEVLVEVDANYFRPNEVDHLCGDASNAKNELGWVPKTKFKKLVEIMIKSDIDKNNNG